MVDSRNTLIGTLVTVGAFGVVGVGLGLTGYIGIDAAADMFMSGDGGGFGQMFVAIIFAQSVFVTWFVGPIVALVVGLANARSMPPRTSGISTTAGSAVGFVVMVAIAVVLMSLALPETGGTGGAGELPTDQMGSMLIAAVPTTVVGAISGGFGRSALDN